MPALTNAKHEAVLQAWISDPERVGWRAYRAVYPKSSQRAAETAWSRLLKDAEFAARRDELAAAVMQGAVERGVMSATEVLEELSKLGRSNVQRFIAVNGDDTGEVIASLRDLDPADAAAIQEITVDTYTEGRGDEARDVKRVRLKLHDKRGALELLARHHKLLTDKHEHADPDGRPLGVAAIEELSELDWARRLAFALEAGARQAAAPAKSSKPAKASKKG